MLSTVYQDITESMRQQTFYERKTYGETPNSEREHVKTYAGGSRLNSIACKQPQKYL